MEGHMQVNIHHFGNLVYYFGYLGQNRLARVTDSEFGTALATFLEINPKLEVSAIAGRSSDGDTVGYFVTFQKKE